MRYLTFFTADRHRIDINNSWLGEETIYYNGIMVSRKSSFFGSVHEFRITENNTEVQYVVHISLRWPFRIGFDIYRNGKALLLS